jgi:hypothetical protein
MECGNGFTIGLVVHPDNPVHESIEVITRTACRHGDAVVARA